MIYGLLGELTIGQDEQVLDLPAGHSLIVLAALLINANHWVSKEDLIRAAWGPDGVKEAQLHKRVMEVRDLLAKVGRRDDLKTHPRSGYELRVVDDDVDALRFQRLVAEARELGARGQSEEEIDRLRQALDLWRGPHPLSNVPTDAFRHDTIALERRRKRAAVRLFDLELARGGHERILDDLISIAGHYPTDRRLCEQLMLALHKCGHTTDATGAYEHYREALAEETGGEPDPLLRRLYFALVRSAQDEIEAAEAVVARRAGASVAQVVSIPKQLPRDSELVGRDDLAAEVSWLLRRAPDRTTPVIVICGPGGIGKTALAVRVSHESKDRYPDGQLFAELRASTGGPVDTTEVLAQFLRSFGMSRVPEAKAERGAAYRSLLAGKRVLVVLDDASDGAQVTDLAPANPGCTVVVTARRRLPDITGAHHVAPLEPLLYPAATQLFLRVVHGAGIRLEDDPEVLDRVVRLCGGLPLALRIAGALRVRDHPRPTGELADRLARQGPDAFAYGELSLARTIGAGFDRLGESARRLFLELGLLGLPDHALWTAAALLDTDAPGAAAVLSQLAASFMIESVEPGPRYRLHDLTREYADRRARAEFGSDRPAAVTERAGQVLLTLVRRAHRNLYRGDFEVVHSSVADRAAPPAVLAEVDASPLGWFEKERLNIRELVDRCASLGLVELCWDLAVSTHELYTLGGYFDDWYATHTAALGACRAGRDLRGEGVVLTVLGQPALVASRPAGAVSGPPELERAVELLGASHELHGQAMALRTLANALRRRGYLARPLALFRDALAGYEASGDTVGRCLTLRFIGQTHLDLGDDTAARQALAAAEAVARELGDGRLIAQARYWIGQAELATGDLDGARTAFDDVLDVYRDEPGVGHAYATHGLGEVARRRGEFADAERHFDTAVHLARAGADAALEGRVWLSIADLHQARVDSDEQAQALAQAVPVFAACGAVYLEVRALAALGDLYAQRGEAAAAAVAWSRVAQRYADAQVPETDRRYHQPATRA